MKCIINFPITCGLIFLWFQKEMERKKKITRRALQIILFLFFSLMPMDDLNHLCWLKTHNIISLFFFFFNTFSNVGKCLMLLKSRKRTFWIQQKEGSQVFRVLGEPAPLNLCIRFYLVLTPYCGFLCSFFPDFFFVWKSS